MKKQFLTFILSGFLLVLGTNAKAQSGKALVLDGATGTNMKVLNNTALNVPSGESRTVTYWIKSTQKGANPRLVSRRSGLGVGYEFYYGSSAGKVAFNVTATEGGGIGSGYGSVDVADGNWHHIAHVLDNQASGSSKIYIDGILDAAASKTWTGPKSITNTLDLFIGQDNVGANLWTGTIDNIRFYNTAMDVTAVTTDKNTLLVNNSTPNLLYAWDFENVSGNIVAEVKGNTALNGTLNGTAKVQNVFNKYLALDGTANTFMRVTDHADLNIASGQSYTISAKIKTTTILNGYRLISKRGGTGNKGYEFITSNSGQFGVNLQGSEAAGPTYSTATINNDTWKHVAMVVDGTAGTCKIYVDGTLDKSKTWTAKPQDFTNAVDLIIGADGGGNSRWVGIVDDIRLWNKAMTDAEVVADKTAIITGPITNLMASWDFESVTGNTVPDISGNNHPGILNGNAEVQETSNQMVYRGVSLYQAEVPVGKGDVDSRIISVNVKTEGAQNPISITELAFTMNGTSNIADVSNIKIYYTTNSNRFNTSSLFATVSPQSGTITATGSQQLNSGNNYFWIAYDVASNATENNVLDATCEAVKVGGSNFAITVPNNTVDGSRTIFITNSLLFSGGDYGSSSYRIPAIVTAVDGSLVTATDKRFNGAGDLRAKIDPVIRRSTDYGKTWSAPVSIANSGGPNGAGDVALVVDKIKNPGTILAVFAANQGLFASTPSNPIRVQYSKSTDNGVTWSAVTDITDQVYGDGCTNPTRKLWYGAFLTSGAMTQLRDGRIIGIMAVRTTSAGTLSNYSLYSDDGGITWSVGTGVAMENIADEAKVVELNNGNLLMSTRRSGGRRLSISTDKGNTWGSPTLSTITDPNCNGDMIRYSSTLDGHPENILLHSVPNAGSRKNVTVYMSKDEGNSWSVLKTIYPQASAYSALTVLFDGAIGVYYENGEYDTYQMYFSSFKVATVTLPITLASISGKCQNNGFVLQWETAQEINGNFFEVMNSEDGITWAVIGKVNAKGNNRTAESYAFTDTKGKGQYYKLRMVDKDGSEAFSKVISSNCLTNQWSAVIAPNPVKENSLLSISGVKRNSLKLEIYTVSGQMVWAAQVKVNNGILNYNLPTVKLPKGVYCLKINDPDYNKTISFVK